MRSTTRLITAGLLSVATPAIAQPSPSDEGVPAPPPDNSTWAPPPAQTAPPPPPESTPPPAPPPPPSTAAIAPATEPVTPSAEPPYQISDDAEQSTQLDIYGFAMLDGGYDFGQIGDPNWQDTLRPTKLPSFTNQFGKGGRTFEGVRQSRFGVSTITPTSVGEVKTKFEFELFGVGVDEGQTTFRLRHAYGEWNGIIAGQTWSPFMDPDVFPDSIEYWGPNGMVFFRNVQLAYRPWQRGEKSNITIALERPGASADTANFADRLDLTDVVPRFPAPDVSADAQWGGDWGHIRAAGIFRYMKWDDLAPTPVVQGHVYGWGVNVSSNLKLGPTTLKLQAVYGSAIENYMNDAAFDVGPSPSTSSTGAATIDGVGLPVLGIVAFIDVKWNTHFSSSAGYSYVHIDNSDGQTPDAFHSGHYALGNLLFHPTDNLFFGPEFQFDRRTNNSDGFTVNDYKLQFSAKYSFSHTFGGK